jgi:hypothetical protein
MLLLPDHKHDAWSFGLIRGKRDPKLKLGTYTGKLQHATIHEHNAQYIVTYLAWVVTLLTYI